MWKSLHNKKIPWLSSNWISLQRILSISTILSVLLSTMLFLSARWKWKRRKSNWRVRKSFFVCLSVCLPWRWGQLSSDLCQTCFWRRTCTSRCRLDADISQSMCYLWRTPSGGKCPLWPCWPPIRERDSIEKWILLWFFFGSWANQAPLSIWLHKRRNGEVPVFSFFFLLF